MKNINSKIQKEKIILIDIDGVACDHASSIVKKINKDYDLNFRPQDVLTWDFDFGPITFTQAVEKYYPNKNFIINMEVEPGFHNFLNKIEKKMHVQFATNRKEYYHLSTKIWIVNNFGSNYKVNFINIKANTKYFDFLVDDNVNEILAVAKCGKKAFLYLKPWNNNIKTKNKIAEYKNIYPIKDFLEIFEII